MNWVYLSTQNPETNNGWILHRKCNLLTSHAIALSPYLLLFFCISRRKKVNISGGFSISLNGKQPRWDGFVNFRIDFHIIWGGILLCLPLGLCNHIVKRSLQAAFRNHLIFYCSYRTSELRLNFHWHYFAQNIQAASSNFDSSFFLKLFWLYYTAQRLKYYRCHYSFSQ